MDGIDLLATKIAALADTMAAPATAAALEAARMMAWSTLVSGGLNLVFAVAVFFIAPRLWAKPSNNDYDFPFFKFVAGLLGVIACICFLVGVWAFADPWTWTTIQHPELWLARKALGL